MKGWLMRFFGLRDQVPLDRPPALDAPPRTDPIPPKVRDVQHDADNVMTVLRGSAELRRRRVDTQADTWRRDHA